MGMKILCSIHLYPPKHNCGAEYMIHGINKYLISKGHEVRVLLWQANHYQISSMYCFDGVDVFPPDQYIVDKLFDWADFVFTHLDYTDQTIKRAAIMNKKVFHLIHNHTEYPSITHAERPQYILYNSEVAKNKLKYNHESMVLHPPVDWRFYDTGKDSQQNEFITLINLDGNKGGEILKQIALRMPERKFLGIKGSYSEPAHTGQIIDQPSNVCIEENTTNIKGVYERTRILIMPSEFESWGRTATEAMCSGIPVISSGTEGLRENCGNAGIYVDRNDIDGWVKAIKMLDDGRSYNKYKRLSKERSRELDPLNELNKLEEWLCSLR